LTMMDPITQTPNDMLTKTLARLRASVERVD